MARFREFHFGSGRIQDDAKPYHLYHDSEQWVLLGHGNTRASSVSDRYTDIRSDANDLMSSGRAFAVIHWEYTETYSRWEVKKMYLSPHIAVEGTEVAAVRRLM